MNVIAGKGCLTWVARRTVAMANIKDLGIMLGVKTAMVSEKYIPGKSLSSAFRLPRKRTGMAQTLRQYTVPRSHHLPCRPPFSLSLRPLPLLLPLLLVLYRLHWQLLAVLFAKQQGAQGRIHSV